MDSNKSQKSETKQWTQLPPELLDTISSKLTEPCNFIRFRSVCKSWRSAAKVTNLPPQLPLLMLRYNPNDSTRSFFNLSTNKVHTIDLPELQGNTICGSSSGWLVLINSKLNISLLNPFTRSTINLPHTAGTFIRALKLKRRELERRDLYLIPREFECHPFMSSYPELPHDSVIVFAKLNTTRFVYCRVGDVEWTEVNSEVNGKASVAYHNGKLYFMGVFGSVYVCDINGDPFRKFVAIPSLKMPSYYFFSQWGGDLLLVKHVQHVEGGVRENHFQIYRLDVKENSIHSWVKLKEIGGLKVFYHLYFPNCNVISDAAGCRGNSVYFHTYSNCGEREQLSAYSIETDTVELLPHYQDFQSNLAYSLWFSLKFF